MLTTFKKQILYATVASAIVLGGCATTSEQASVVDKAQSDYQLLASDPNVQKYAVVQLQEAKKSIDKAEALVDSSESDDAINHQLYIVNRKLEITSATAQRRVAEVSTENADERRQQALLEAKEQDLKQAQAVAEVYRAQALAAQEHASEMEDRAVELSQKVDNLTTKKTDRGLVLTFGDILFETAKSSLKPGAERTLERVAEFLDDYPERQILVEGFTDSVGSDSYNRTLSEQRAESVMDALADSGVEQTRMEAKGYGESYPVASNDTSEGRQLNRRVEVLILNPDSDQVTTAN